jgi:hypothetical protein
MVLSPISIGECVFSCSTSHMTSCTPTKSNLYLYNSLSMSLGRLPYMNSYIPVSKSHVYISLLRSFIQRIHLGQRLLRTFQKKLLFFSEGLSVPHSTHKLDDNPPYCLSMAACSIYITCISKKYYNNQPHTNCVYITNVHI